MVWKRVFWLFLGGFFFWAPTTVLELMTRHELALTIGSILPVATLMSAYFLTRPKANAKPAKAPWMLLGLFLLGPLFITVGATSHGGGFAQPFGWHNLVNLVLCSVIPFMTIIMAGYNGTIVGVLVATILLTVIHFRVERARV